MTRINQILAGVLVVQALLVPFTWSHSGPSVTEPTRLVPFDTNAVTAIEITSPPPEDGGAPSELRLERADGHWGIASADGFPADDSKVEDLLEKLTKLEVRSPIATQAASFNALDVGDREYGAKVKVEAGSSSAELYLGTASSGAANVRVVGKDAAYVARGITVFDASDKVSRWVNTEYVKVDPDTVSSLTVTNEHGTIELVKDESGTWTTPGLPPERMVDATAVSTLLKRAGTVRMTEPAGKLAPTMGISPTGLGLDWTATTGDTTETGGYRVGGEAPGATPSAGLVYVSATGSPFAVKARGSSFKDLRDATLDTLTKDAPPPVE